jgi:hypothetical protein
MRKTVTRKKGKPARRQIAMRITRSWREQIESLAAFGGDTPPLPLNELRSANDRSEQEGFKLLTMGAMSGMRNLYSHGDVTS